jgi:Phytanoyl-CoA dioxygenase (PhyH)
MARWAKHGYFVIRDFLSPNDIRKLRRSCDIVLDQIRAESSDLGHSNANIAYLTEPRYFTGERPSLIRLLEFVGTVRVRKLISGLCHPDEAPLIFHNTQYFHEQTTRDWDGNWHRDSQFGLPDAEAERQFALTTTAVHFRVAFVSDDRLEFVPGSHARWDTTDEFQIRKGSVQNDSMPGSDRIALEPGDACVFHAWGIHRGTYRRTPIRRTLDIIYGFGPCRPGPATPPLTCFRDSEILGLLSHDARCFFEDFVATYRKYWTLPPTQLR